MSAFSQIGAHRLKIQQFGGCFLRRVTEQVLGDILGRFGEHFGSTLEGKCEKNASGKTYEKHVEKDPLKREGKASSKSGNGGGSALLRINKDHQTTNKHQPAR